MKKGDQEQQWKQNHLDKEKEEKKRGRGDLRNMNKKERMKNKKAKKGEE